MDKEIVSPKELVEILKSSPYESLKISDKLFLRVFNPPKTDFLDLASDPENGPHFLKDLIERKKNNVTLVRKIKKEDFRDFAEALIDLSWETERTGLGGKIFSLLEEAFDCDGSEELRNLIRKRIADGNHYMPRKLEICILLGKEFLLPFLEAAETFNGTHRAVERDFITMGKILSAGFRTGDFSSVELCLDKLPFKQNWASEEHILVSNFASSYVRVLLERFPYRENIKSFTQQALGSKYFAGFQDLKPKQKLSETFFQESSPASGLEDITLEELFSFSFMACKFLQEQKPLKEKVDQSSYSIFLESAAAWKILENVNSFHPSFDKAEPVLEILRKNFLDDSQVLFDGFSSWLEGESLKQKLGSAPVKKIVRTKI